MSSSVVTYPLPTVAAMVTTAGIVSPALNDILESYKAQVKSIYGSDLYLEADSKDGQFLAIMAQTQFDSNQVAIACWNAFNPQTATGTALDASVKLNGIRRQIPSNSTVTLRIVGQAGTNILGGIAMDINNGLWDLPATVVIPLSGEILVTATAEQQGTVAALPGDINRIFTQVSGWQTVYNPAAAEPGAPVESDGALRQRQKASTSLAARTTDASLKAQVANIAGVKRAEIYSNDTGAPDANGVPAHSFNMVVEGGDVQEIAQAIADKKDVGSGTAGGTVEQAIDPNGNPIAIRFDILTTVPIYVSMWIRKRAGFQDLTVNAIRQGMVNYINSLGIGEWVYLSWTGAAASNSVDQSFVVTSVQQGTDPNVAGVDIPIAFNQAATTTADKIVINEAL